MNIGVLRTKPATIDSFYKNLEKQNIDKVYFSEDLKNVYFQEKYDEDGLEIPAYRTIVSNPLMTDRIIERSEKSEIYPIFLQNPPNPVSETVKFIGDSANFLFTPLIFFLVLRSFVSFQQGVRGQGMPFSNPLQRDQDDDKANMQKANITLDSWKGSPEVFQECTEIVSFLKNATMYQEAGAEIPKGDFTGRSARNRKDVDSKGDCGRNRCMFFGGFGE